MKGRDIVKRIRIMVAGIFVLGILIGGVSLYGFLHTEAEPVKTADRIKETLGKEEEELGDILGGKTVPKDYGMMIDNKLTIFSKTQLKRAKALKIPATYEGEKVHSIELVVEEGSPFLKYVEIENGVEKIEDSFVGCTNLETAVLPKSIKKMDKWEFKDCKKKVTLYVEKDSYAEKWAKKHKIRYKYGRPKEEIAIDYKELD